MVIKKNEKTLYFEVEITMGLVKRDMVLNRSQIEKLRKELKKENIHNKLVIKKELPKPPPIKKQNLYEKLPVNADGYKYILRSECCLDRVLSAKLICGTCEAENVNVIVFTEISKTTKNEIDR